MLSTFRCRRIIKSVYRSHPLDNANKFLRYHRHTYYTSVVGYSENATKKTRLATRSGENTWNYYGRRVLGKEVRARAHAIKGQRAMGEAKT